MGENPFPRGLAELGSATPPGCPETEGSQTLFPFLVPRGGSSPCLVVEASPRPSGLCFVFPFHVWAASGERGEPKENQAGENLQRE